MKMVKIKHKGKYPVPVGASYLYPGEVKRVRNDDAVSALAAHPNDLEIDDERSTERAKKPTRKRRNTPKKRSE